MASDWRRADLDEADRALCAFAEKLTLRQTQTSKEDIDALREVGFDDRAIHDTVQIVSLFNYYPRIAHGLGVELEDESHVRPWGESKTSEES